jgi:hypothetical protein
MAVKGIVSSFVFSLITANTNALNAVTLSLRAREGCAAISFIITRLLRHFIPRNDTLLNAFVLVDL